MFHAIPEHAGQAELMGQDSDVHTLARRARGSPAPAGNGAPQARTLWRPTQRESTLGVLLNDMLALRSLTSGRLVSCGVEGESASTMGSDKGTISTRAGQMLRPRPMPRAVV